MILYFPKSTFSCPWLWQLKSTFHYCFSPSSYSFSISYLPIIGKFNVNFCSVIRKSHDSAESFINIVKSSSVKTSNKVVHIPENTFKGKKTRSLKILTYNVWFGELQMYMRMRAIGDLIQLHSPDIICFQEVTPDIYNIFQQLTWWKLYSCSVSIEMAITKSYFCMQLSKLPVKSFTTRSFSNSIMGRELCIAEIQVKSRSSLIIATTHLESPCPGPPRWDQMFSKERIYQARESLEFLKKLPNAILCGDMNWDYGLDGPFPLPEGWVDAWAELRRGEIGWTYDTKTNKMLSENFQLQRRLDRFVCGLRNFEIRSIEMVGTEAIPGVFYDKVKKVKHINRTLVLPVFPSDHYGLLLTISTR